MLLGVTLDNRLHFDAHIPDICCKVGEQVTSLNRLKNNLPCKTNRSDGNTGKRNVSANGNM